LGVVDFFCKAKKKNRKTKFIPGFLTKFNICCRSGKKAPITGRCPDKSAGRAVEGVEIEVPKVLEVPKVR